MPVPGPPEITAKRRGRGT
ncbi:hypothetical protein VCEC0012_002388A, partial [Vibrio cholerae O1 str. EC-0012]